MGTEREVSSSLVLLALMCLGIPFGGCRQQCPVTKEEHQAVVQKLQAVERELDDLKNGPDRMIKEARAATEARNFEEVVRVSTNLLERHPGTEEAKEAARLKTDAEKQLASIEAERKKIEEAEARERERQAVEEKRREEQRVANATRSMKKEEDKVRGLAFYTDRNSPPYLNSRSDLHLYFSAEGSRPLALRLRIQYVADDWLFIQKYIIKADDQTYTIPASYGDVERDNGSGGIWEWYDKVITKDQVEMVKAVIRSRNAVLRYEGQQYYKDRTISAGEKKRLENVLTAFEALGGNP